MLSSRSLQISGFTSRNVIMFRDDEGLEISRIVSDDHDIRLRHLSAFNSQFANTTQREACKELSLRDRSEYLQAVISQTVLQKRSFADFQTDYRHNSEANNLLRKTPLQLQWCSELHFIGQKSSPFKLKVMPIETFPGHRVQRKNFVMLEPSDRSDQQNNDKLGLVSTTRSDNNEFRDSHVGGKPLAALASFPGSGNTWLRYLLQQATGILTGSVYKDYGLLKSGFPAESIANSSVLLVKTHEWGSHVWEKFGKAILLVRDPAKAILAEFNRQSGGHVGFASPDRYKRTKGKCESCTSLQFRAPRAIAISNIHDRLDEVCDQQAARVGTNKLIMGTQL